MGAEIEENNYQKDIEKIKTNGYNLDSTQIDSLTSEDGENLQNHINNLRNPKPANGKELLQNGKSEVSEFELPLDLLIIPYLIKLLTQAQKDGKNFKNNEENIKNNCQNNNIEYALNNEKDKVSSVAKGIKEYHDLNTMRQKFASGQATKEELDNAEQHFKETCKNNHTVDVLCNSTGDACALAHEGFHAGVWTSTINDKGEKSFTIIDQQGRKMPLSGWMSDDELTKCGINIAEVASTNGMCMATAQSALENISQNQNGVKAFLNKYANVVRHSERQNVVIKNNKQQNQQSALNFISIGNGKDTINFSNNTNNKTTANTNKSFSIFNIQDCNSNNNTYSSNVNSNIKTKDRTNTKGI